MTLQEVKDLCAMTKAAGIATLWELQIIAHKTRAATPDSLLLLAEALWDAKRGTALNESNNKRR